MHESSAQSLNLPFRRREWSFFAAVIAANLTLDVAAMWVEHWFVLLGGQDVPAVWMEAFSLACLFGQIVILAIWAALFPGSNLLRVLLATLAVCSSTYLLMWLARVLAPAVIEFRSWAKLSGLTFIVIVFYAVQILFWVLRFALGWRIVLDGEPFTPMGERHRYSMLHALGWMAFLSVLLGLGQVYIGRSGLDVALVVGFLALVSWLYGVPYLWSTLRGKRLLSALAVFIAASVVATLLGWRLYLLFYPRVRATQTLQAFLFVQGGAAVVGLGTGVAARLFGYRLITHWRERRS